MSNKFDKGIKPVRCTSQTRTRSEEIIDVGMEIVSILVTLVTTIFKLHCVVFEALYQVFVPVQPKPVKGEIVLITGSGQGIGKQMALLYASQGATVVGWDVNAKTNEETVKEISERGYPKAYSYVCDVSNRESVFETAEKVRRDVGDVTILINNAGIMPTHPLLEHTQQEIERVFSINLTAHCWTIQAFLPAMKKQNHGHIVAISSCAGLFGMVNLGPYCASKYAVRGLMEALSDELRQEQSQVQTTTICPYMVNTGLCKNPVVKFKSFMKLLEPEEVAHAVMRAQTTNQVELSVPGYLRNVNNFGRLFPSKGTVCLKEAFDVSLETDLS